MMRHWVRVYDDCVTTACGLKSGDATHSAEHVTCAACRRAIAAREGPPPPQTIPAHGRQLVMPGCE